MWGSPPPPSCVLYVELFYNTKWCPSPLFCAWIIHKCIIIMVHVYMYNMSLSPNLTSICVIFHLVYKDCIILLYWTLVHTILFVYYFRWHYFFPIHPVVCPLFPMVQPHLVSHLIIIVMCVSMSCYNEYIIVCNWFYFIV